MKNKVLNESAKTCSFILLPFMPDDLLHKTFNVEQNHVVSFKMVKKEETSEAPIEEITNELSDVEKGEEKFNGVSQTLRRELEHFDYVMREEFEKAFAAYGATYFGSLSKSKIMDDSSTRPTTELLALTVEEPKQYEEMSAVSYHM